MSYLPPMLINLTEEETQSELIDWLQNFGNVCNFDDTTAFSRGGSIVYGVVHKIFTPVQLQNGMFNCVFIMKQANHLLVPHEEFRILLQLNSSELLRKLEVGSFLAVFNPRLFHVEGRKSFSSGPEGIMWYSVSAVPVSRLKVVKEMAGRPASVSSSLTSLKVQSIKKIVSHPLPQPLPSTSTYDRSRGSDDRCNMPPPSTWIDTRKNLGSKHRTSNITFRDSRTSKTSDPSKGSCSPHSSHHKSQRSHHSERHSNNHPPSVTDRCCLHTEHRTCHCAPNPYREPTSSYGSVHHSCGSRHNDHGSTDLLNKFLIGLYLQSQSPKCWVHQNTWGNNINAQGPSFGTNMDAHGSGSHRASEKSFYTTQEGNQWFVKEWVKQTTSRIGEETLTLPGRCQGIDSQPLTGRATCGGSVNEASDDDENFTSVSQALTPVDPPGGRMAPTLQRHQQTITRSNSGSDSSLSDTSTLFLKPSKPLLCSKPLVRVGIEAEKQRPHGLPATSVVEVMEDNPTMSKDTSSTSESSSSPSNLSLQQVHERGDESIHNEPISDKCERLNSSMTDDTQKTCSQVFSAPAGPPGGNGSDSDSDSVDIPVQTKKKRKLMGLSDSSWYYDSARRYADVPSSSNQESSEKLRIKPSEVEEPSSMPEIVTNPADIDVIASENGEGQNGRVMELTTQESVDIISSSDIEHMTRNETCFPKPSVLQLVSSLQLDKLVASFTKERASESSSADIVVPELKTTDRISSINQLDVGDQVTKDIIATGAAQVLVESSPIECQTMGGVNDADLSNDIPFVNDTLPTQSVPVKQSQKSSEILARGSVATHLSPDSPIVDNETLFDMNMSLCEPLEENNVAVSNPTTSAENPPEFCDKYPIITSNDENQIFETSSPEQIEIPTAVDSKSKDLSRQSPNFARGSVATHLSSDSPIVDNETLFDMNMSLCEPSEEKNVAVSNPTTSAKNPPEFCDRNPIITSNDENQIFETSSPEQIETPTAVDSKSKDWSRQSPNQATVSDVLSEELQPEITLRPSPASTVFYDALADNLTENQLEGVDIAEVSNEDNISEIISIPNHTFDVLATIEKIEPRVNRKNPSCIIQGVCRRKCKSRFSYEAIKKMPIVIRCCEPCAVKSHHVCPSCLKKGLQKPLCLEFSFELHVSVGKRIIRLQVERQEGVKFLGIRARGLMKKSRVSRHIVEILESISNPTKETPPLTGHVRILNKILHGNIVPLLVDTRLKDFNVGRNHSE